MAMISVMITITRIVAILLLVLPMVLVLLLMNPEATFFENYAPWGWGVLKVPHPHTLLKMATST